MNRLGLLRPSDLDDEQRELYDEMLRITTAGYGDKFVYVDAEGRLVGPFGLFLHTPHMAMPFLNLSIPLSGFNLSPSVYECTILGVASRTKAAYQEYAHQRLAGFPVADLQEMHEGRMPAGHTDQEKAAFELAMELAEPGPLPQSSYERYEKVLGSDIRGVIHLAGFYYYVSTLLNAFDVQIPE